MATRSRECSSRMGSFADGPALGDGETGPRLTKRPDEWEVTEVTLHAALCGGRGKVPLTMVPMDTFLSNLAGGIVSPSRLWSRILGDFHEHADYETHSHRATLGSGHAYERRRDGLPYGSSHDMRGPRRMCRREPNVRSPHFRCRVLLQIRTAARSIQPPRPRQLIRALRTCCSECGTCDGKRSSSFNSPSF